MKIHELIKFGKYSTNTGLDGITNSDAAVMFVQGTEDDTVPQIYGYDIYYEKLHDDPNYRFLMLEGKGHNNICSIKVNFQYEPVLGKKVPILNQFMGTFFGKMSSC